MSQSHLKLIGFFGLIVGSLAGCCTNPPAQVEYKTEIINTACTTFKVIKLPAADLDKIPAIVKAEVLAHDRAWVAACRKG